MAIEVGEFLPPESWKRAQEKKSRVVVEVEVENFVTLLCTS